MTVDEEYHSSAYLGAEPGGNITDENDHTYKENQELTSGYKTVNSRDFEQIWLGDIDSEIERLQKRLNTTNYFPPIPEEIQPISSADAVPHDYLRKRTGTFHFSDDGRLYFATGNLLGEARLRTGLPRPSVEDAREVETVILTDDKDGTAFFAIMKLGEVSQ